MNVGQGLKLATHISETGKRITRTASNRDTNHAKREIITVSGNSSLTLFTNLINDADLDKTSLKL